MQPKGLEDQIVVDYFQYRDSTYDGMISLYAAKALIPYSEFTNDIESLFDGIEVTTEYDVTDERKVCNEIARRTRRGVGEVYKIGEKVFCIYSSPRMRIPADMPIVQAFIGGEDRYARSPLFDSYVVRIR